jgi:chromate reductase, NAD(P)H dehydrogenase (quinone)
MYTVISGTNRSKSLTKRFAEVYVKLLKAQGVEAQFFHLENLPDEVFSSDVYEKVKQPSVKKIQDLFEGTSKFIFIYPEYNGSFPGILKLLIDVMDPKIAFHGRKAGLIGISTGRAGNLRGLDHMTAVLQHMQVTVMPYLLPVSKVQAELTEGHISEAAEKVVNTHIEKMIAF